MSGTWSVGGSPYVVQGDVEIPDGGTLVIDPGVTVQFETDAGLSANGTLTAIGTAASLIRFTSAQVSPSPGDWEGLQVRSSSSSLGWIQIEYAVDGLLISKSSPTVSDCTVRSNAGTGIRVLASAYGCTGSRAAPTIARCEVELNLGNGVDYSGYGSSSVGCTVPKTGSVGGTLSESGVHHNMGTGIVIRANDGFMTRGHANPEILGCEIHDNGGDGILLSGDDDTAPTIDGSDIYLNARSGVSRHSRWGTATITNNELRENAVYGLRNVSFQTIVSGNWIIDNDLAGVVTSQLRRFSENTLYGNAGDYDFYYLDTVDQMAPLNDWGTTDPAVIDSHIWDGLDDAWLGRVVVSPATELVVTPDADLEILGQAGGPFYPRRPTWTLWNTQAGTFEWEIAGVEGWLSLTPWSGTLSPLDSVRVAAETTAEAEDLPLDTYTATLAFQNKATGDGDTERSVRLSVIGKLLAFVDARSDGVYGGAESVAVSPDGAHLFVVSGHTLAVFARDGVTGELALLEEHEDGHGGVDGLFYAYSVALSPDGESVYVTGRVDNAIAVFDRDSATGALVFLEVHKDGSGGADGLAGAASVAVSPDGASVYVASWNDDAVAVFSRDTSTGRLTFVEVQKDGVGGVAGLEHAESIALSPDGTHVYVAAGWSSDFLTVFVRDTSTGTLTFLETHEDGVAGVHGLRGELRVALSPDGAHVYVTSSSYDSVALFTRDPSTGRLTFRRIYEDPEDGEGLNGAAGLAVSGDGAHLYVVSWWDDALSVFRRDAATGELRFVEWHRDGVEGVDGLGNAQAVAVSPDGTHVYVVSNPTVSDGKTALFSRVSALAADVSIAKSDSMDPVAVGGAFDYTLSVTNTGPSSAWGVRVEDTLPAGVSMTEATGTGWYCGENDGLVTCSRESLDVGAAPLLTLSVTAPLEGTVITNTALVGAESFDPDTGDNDTSEQTALLPTLAIGDVSVTESDAGTVAALFTVSLSVASDQEVTVDYATADGTATAGSDYQPGSGTATIPADSTSGTITILVNGDTLDEPDEAFFVNLSNPSNATIADGQGQGTIIDDDAAPMLSIDDVTVNEGDAGTVDAVFTVSLSATSGQEVTADYATADGTAVGGGGTRSNPTPIIIPDNVHPAPAEPYPSSVEVSGVEAVSKVTVKLIGLSHTNPWDLDVLLVGPEGQSTVLMSDVGGSEDITDVTLTFDDDAATSVPTPITSGAYTPSNPHTGDTFPSPAPAGPYGAELSVFVGTNPNGTWSLYVLDDIGVAYGGLISGGWSLTIHTSGVDYLHESGSLTIPAGSGSGTVTVPVTGDTLDELDETFVVNLSNPSNATISDGQGQGTITDDDAAPALSIDDVTVTEGDAGTVDAVFTVSLSAASGLEVTVDYATADGTAVAGSDYVAGAGTLTFIAGETEETLTIAVNGDLLDELDETFFVNLSSPANVTIADGQGQGTITDDDAAPALSIDDVTVTEGDAGTVDAVFTVSLSAASGQEVTVDYATADGTAVASSDYVAGAGTLTFIAGDTAETITIAVNGDLLDELDETFFANLSNPVNATISDGQGTGTITDDDAAPTLAIDDVTVSEGGAGTVDAIFTVSLSAASGLEVTVDYATTDGTALAASDYVAGAGTLTIIAGDTEETVTVAVNGDLLDELDESFFVNLSSSANATISDGQGQGTITDDDSAPSLSIDDVVVTEGDAGTVDAIFTVSLSAASGLEVTVDYATADGTAVAGSDYAAGAGTLTFVAADTEETITIAVNGDLLDEPDETFLVNLANPANATIGDGQGQGTVTDDDEAPTLFINDVTVIEGDFGTVDAVFTVSLSLSSGQEVTVGYATADGTATAGSDYVATSGALTFIAGMTTRNVTVPVNGDTADELDETFVVNLSSPTNATISDTQGTGTITDDERPLIVIKKQTIPEGDPGVFTFTGDLAGVVGDGQRLLLSPTPGTYTSTEVVPSGWSLFKCKCDDSDSVGEMGTATATIELGTDEWVTCVFTNCAESVPSTLDLSGVTVSTIEVYEACDTLTAATFTIESTGDVSFRAGNRIVLGNGFSVAAGGEFTAEIVGEP